MDRVDQCRHGSALSRDDINELGAKQPSVQACGTSAATAGCNYCYCRFVGGQEDDHAHPPLEFDNAYTWYYIQGGSMPPYDPRAQFATVDWCDSDIQLGRLRILFYLISGVTLVSIIFYIYSACKARELAMQTDFFELKRAAATPAPVAPSSQKYSKSAAASWGKKEETIASMARADMNMFTAVSDLDSSNSQFL